MLVLSSDSPSPANVSSPQVPETTQGDVQMGDAAPLVMNDKGKGKERGIEEDNIEEDDVEMFDDHVQPKGGSLMIVTVTQFRIPQICPNQAPIFLLAHLNCNIFASYIVYLDVYWTGFYLYCNQYDSCLFEWEVLSLKLLRSMLMSLPCYKYCPNALSDNCNPII